MHQVSISFTKVLWNRSFRRSGPSAYIKQIPHSWFLNLFALAPDTAVGSGRRRRPCLLKAAACQLVPVSPEESFIHWLRRTGLQVKHTRATMWNTPAMASNTSANCGPCWRYRLRCRIISSILFGNKKNQHISHSSFSSYQLHCASFQVFVWRRRTFIAVSILLHNLLLLP